MKAVFLELKKNLITYWNFKVSRMKSDHGLFCRMLRAFNGLKDVLSQATQFLMTSDQATYSPENHVFNVDEMRDNHDSLPEKMVVGLKNEEQ